jgi:glycosyltransferase involved in cell wall biosynthesis
MNKPAFKFAGLYVSVSEPPLNAALSAIGAAARMTGDFWGICNVTGKPARFNADLTADTGSSAAQRRAICAQSLALYGDPHGTKAEIQAGLAAYPVYADADRAAVEAYARARGWQVSARCIWSRGFGLLDDAPIYIAHRDVLATYSMGELVEPGSSIDSAYLRQIEIETGLLIAQMMGIEDADRAALYRAFTDTQRHLESILRTRAWKLIGAYYRLKERRAPAATPPPSLMTAAPSKSHASEPLAGGGDTPIIEIGAPNGKSALILAPSVPAYDRESGARRLDHLIGMLCALGWAVALRVETLDGGDSYLPRLREAGVDVHLVGTPPPSPPDLILIQFWGVAEAHLPGLRAAYPDARILIDSVDLHFVRELRGGDFSGAGVTFGRELAAYRAADGTLTVSQKEADWLMDLLPGIKAHVLPLMETFAPSMIPFSDRRGIVFLGSFRHQPNVDALDWLLREIVPLLDPDLLAAHLLSVIGYGLHEYAPAHAALRLHGIEMIGAVESVVPYLERARLMAAPLRFGAGTKGKLIQAALIGTPSVTTRIGVEGLPLVHEQSVLIADDAPAFAAAVTRLLNDEPLWERLSSEARQQIEAQHSREAVMARWRAVLSELGFDQGEYGSTH